MKCPHCGDEYTVTDTRSVGARDFPKYMLAGGVICKRRRLCECDNITTVELPVEEFRRLKHAEKHLNIILGYATDPMGSE